MKIKSLGLKTDLMLLQGEAIIKDRGDYISVITPDHLSFYWGNHLIYPKGPVKGDYENWIADFKDCFKNYKIKHMAFIWDKDNDNDHFVDYSEFEKNGFEYDDMTILVAKKVNIKYLNNEISMKSVTSEEDWRKAIHFQTAADPEIYKDMSKPEIFFKKRFSQYKKLINSGLGRWYIAKINNNIVSSLGLFWNQGVARYQLVKTHKEYRRRGIAQTLMKFASEDSQCGFFIIEADRQGPSNAISMYQSIGFKVRERGGGLCKGT